MNPVAVLLLHQRQQRRSSASLSMWPAIPEPCRHRNIASSAGPWRRGHATPHKRLSCLVFHNELHELDEFHCSLLSFILHSSFGAPRHHSSRQRTRIRLIRVICKGLFEFWPQKTGGIGHERVTRSKKCQFLRFLVNRWLTDGYTDIYL